MRRIASHLALLPTGIVSKPLITLCDDQIVAIEGWERLDAMAGVEFYAGILVPSLVNVHCHLELSYLSGQVERRGGFAAFAAGVARTRNLFTAEEREDATRKAAEEMWLEGVVVLKDFRDYVRVKSELNRDYGSEEFLAKCVRNTANGGKFSSDRSILDYAENVWKL